MLIGHEEYLRRLDRIKSQMAEQEIPALLISDNANKYYLTGRVYAGYAYIPVEGEPIFFIRRPVELKGDGVVYIRKPEEIALTIGLNVPEAIGLELDVLPYSTAMRLKKIFPESELKNASTVMRQARAVKTEEQIDMIRRSGVKHVHVYSRIPHLFQPGMTDLGLQVEIERVSRLEGCLGQFRISGDSMELHMGNVLVGDNADAPSPYDFAMGGAGLDPSIPVGANGTPIKPGDTIMVDMNGNFDGYMTDMTRVFALGEIKPLAIEAHKCSIDIHRALCGMMRPGMLAKDLYAKAEEIVKERDLHPYYMGHRQHAGFIGHGVGIEINELPVIAPRSRDIIAEGNVIALEPKFVIPGTGAVGIENTYAVYADHVECLTPAPEDIAYFDV
ncbi:MAG: Xaa-Pro peptidase family protein [Duncaniella sp.]|nr:Xaa-Pro peptidase family protein [Duncaniella sp.]MDE6062354.1 Xaa-Pro peptidase family protein [Duncaniella sp.]MDE6823386.1 Xaa-Pro peptidase family protein [Duncaniella sp.]